MTPRAQFGGSVGCRVHEKSLNGIDQLVVACRSVVVRCASSAGRNVRRKQCRRSQTVGFVATTADAARRIAVEEYMATGTVNWFSDEKGFGFITPDEGSKDLFVHHTSIEADGYRSLAEGSRVEYESEAGDKGPKAINVRAI